VRPYLRSTLIVSAACARTTGLTSQSKARNTKTFAYFEDADTLGGTQTDFGIVIPKQGFDEGNCLS